MSDKARDFAIEAHGDQTYGDGQPYRVHLFAVHQVVRDFGYDGPYAEAAWLHDVLEDTPITFSQLSANFSGQVCSLVLACTGEGKNRRERNACIYDRISRYPQAAIVKVADRIANVEASAEGSSHRSMYRKEADAFWSAVARHVPDTMQDRLSRAYIAQRDQSS